ncbi:relaxase [Vibrio sp. SS-MA-C1-2]|uniref:LPD7 domain-containing protein n=1 Tax=Vibrio sp. SS-MA-C1-2 TaxID=2908646 RepID=UPI001F31F32F|nr:LPD7 domain-containing protein [Vibrio sp. SS-MA-C1-2]UJF17238.1 relaxase [Vibrio sp. SS-MA-C1-2]
MVKDRKPNNYLHITLSFSENDISVEKVTEAYELYKEKVMSAYDCNEYNIYAEIHQPKVKNIKDKKTGENIARLSHVHIVLPLENLVTGKRFNPFGKYTNNINYHDAIQESVNRKLNLSSPYDNQRKGFINHSDFISRYKGDTFKKGNVELKKTLFDTINNKNIRTMEAFESELSKHGQVSVGKKNQADEYLQIKPHGKSKNIRLKEACFKSDYIVDRQLECPKPTDKEIKKLVNEWASRRSHEMKYIHPASLKEREHYKNLTKDEKRCYLNDKQINPGQGRRQVCRQSRFKPVTQKTFTDIRNGLPSLSQRHVDGGNRQSKSNSQSILQNNERDHLEPNRTGRNNELRRSSNNRQRRGVTPTTVITQLLNNHNETQIKEIEAQQFKHIKQTLKPEYLLKALEIAHGVEPDDYLSFRAKDGSARIKTGARALNVSDFCTKYMNLTWDETKAILNTSHKKQEQTELENKVINSITFISQYTTQSSNRNKRARLDESIMVLKHLQKQEKLMDNLNRISGSEEISLVKTTEQVKKQQQLLEQLSMKMSDLVAVKDVEKSQVQFKDKHSGYSVFKDLGHEIVLNERKPSDDHVAAAVTMAAEKFGELKISGNKDFKQQVIDIAVVKDLNVVFSDKRLQAEFLEQKANFSDQNKVDSSDRMHVKEASSYSVTYQYKGDHLNVKVNDKQPNAMPSQVLDRIVKSDAFLKNYSVNDIQSGKLDLSEAKGIQPIPKTYDENAQPIREEKQTKSIQATV